MNSYIHTYIHTDTASVQHGLLRLAPIIYAIQLTNVRLAQLCILLVFGPADYRSCKTFHLLLFVQPYAFATCCDYCACSVAL